MEKEEGGEKNKKKKMVLSFYKVGEIIKKLPLMRPCEKAGTLISLVCLFM